MGKLTKLRSTIPLIFSTFFLAFGLKAQNVSVNGSTSVDGSYATLGAAFTAINGEAQTSKTIAISITGNTTEHSTATLNNKGWKSLSIFPAGDYTISGVGIAGALIHFSGDTAVTVDGLNSGGKSLRIENNMTVESSAIFFTGDCKNILIQNCTILGACTDADFAAVLFGSGFTTGNDSIKINACTIGGGSVSGIRSVGSLGANQENSNNSITNCLIGDYYSDLHSSNGIYLGAGNTAWNISGNRFYQSATRTYGFAKTHTAIGIASGNGHTVLNNIIGYANAAGTGTYTMTSTVGARFIAIDIAAGSTTPSSVQGNTISGISFTTASANIDDYGAFCGIRVASGDVNIGDITGNTIGGTTGVDLITLSSTNIAALVGINIASTGIVTIKNNILGGLSSTSPTITNGSYIYGTTISGIATALTISDNTIGNKTANNMRAGSTTTTNASSVASGIIFSITPMTTTISGNTIQNFTSYGISSSAVRGIITASASGNTSSINITGNTISQLSTNGTVAGLVSGQPAASGISLSIGTKDIIANNTISDINIFSTEAISSYAVGIAHANATGTIIRNNKIFNITNTSTSTNVNTPSVAAGIAVRSATDTLTILNNMISLGSGSSANTAIVGIHANNGSNPIPVVENIYHNTVNISGTVTTGAMPSFGFYRGDFTTTARTPVVNIKNNIFTNSRSGGTGSHYAIANNYGATVSAANWSANAADYNVLNANAATIGWWGANKTFADWKTSSAGDANSYSGYAITYMDPASDLHLNTGTTPTIAESRATVIAGVTTDIDGDKRPGPLVSTNGGGLIPDIGADEIDGVIVDLIPPVITYTALTAACDTASRTLTATIVDSGKVYTTGLLQSRIYYRKNKNAWVSTQGALTAGTASNGTWSFNLNSSALVNLAAGDTVSYFVITQDLGGNVTANPSAGLSATDVNTITTYPTTPNEYIIKLTPTIVSVTGGAVCDSGKVTFNATASAGSLNWYDVANGGSSLGTNNLYTTEVLKTTTPYYVEATDNGCVSVRKSALAVVNHSTDSTLPPVAACETYVWKGKTYITSGIYKDTTKNAAGCDSIITLNLTINHSTTHNDTIKACAPYLWYGNAYTTSGIYKDTIKNKAGCDSLLTLNLTITHVNATVTVLNNVITADSTVDSYQWIDCKTNLPISGETSKVFTATAPSGSYAVIETKNGCVDTSICTPIVITGIASIDKDQLHLYPNPGAGLYTLSLPEKATVTIISLTGEIVYNEQLSKGVNSIDLLKTANGIYIVHVTSAQTQQVLRLIKQE